MPYNPNLPISDTNPYPVTGTIDAGALVDGADATQGSIADAAASAGGTGTTSAKLRLMTSQLGIIAAGHAGEYETVAASKTDQVLGSTGAIGDFLNNILIIPATTSPGAVSIKDGSGSSITVFAGGASSVADLAPFGVPLGMTSTSGGWSVTTGSNVSVIGMGNFT